MADTKDIQPRMLMGPGPSDVSPRVLEALGRPCIGHLDPQFLEILNDIREMLQAVFQTRNELTLAASGTGSAGMETCVVNLIEPGDKMLVCIAGVFGQRMTDVAARAGAEVTAIEVPWGQVFSPEQVADEIRRHGPFKVVGIVHAETSTGAAQPIEPVSRVVHEAGALLLVDTVTSLGGMEVDVDGWQIDACYSGTQKCLSCPPGLAPVTFSPAAVEAIAGRQSKVRSWYLDMNMIRKYWGSERLYHHTAPINMNYALHEALRIVLEEGLEARWQRHALNHQALKVGLAAMGIEYLADPDHQLPMLNAVAAPAGVEEAAVRKRLLNEHAIEFGGGLGAFKGKAWRIGIMGESSTRRHVTTALAALESILNEEGVVPETGPAVAAAEAVYAAQ
ncbi:MAG: pyridoxal-phosphate-dependent aminotransferase family protein [Planctomycetota bacterium]|jgi:alanine-glyoxylate transaminase/serine-glyoxylate transaminase/serine-pyruvate transaminase